MSALLQSMQPLFLPAFTAWGSPVTWLECVAFVLALAMVLLNIRVNPLGWPLAIVSSLLYFALFWDSRLYGDASLQIFFALVAVWGWWQWLRGTAADGAALRMIAKKRSKKTTPNWRHGKAFVRRLGRNPLMWHWLGCCRIPSSPPPSSGRARWSS